MVKARIHPWFVGWFWVECFHCRGTGMYDGGQLSVEPMECPNCSSGYAAVHLDSGVLAEYPGGAFVGHATEAEREACRKLVSAVPGYPDEWPYRAWQVKADAGWRCIRCGHPDVPHWPTGYDCDELCLHPEDGKQRRLTVHHLDGVKDNLRWWNLVALCQVCHLQIQGRVKMEQTWPFEHSEWFKPYVAGYYGSTILGIEYDREQVESRLEELLALGQKVQMTGDRRTGGA